MSVEDFGVTAKCRDTIDENKRLQLVLSIGWLVLSFAFALLKGESFWQFVIDLAFFNGLLGLYFLMSLDEGFLGVVFEYTSIDDMSFTYYLVSLVATICGVALLGVDLFFNHGFKDYIFAFAPLPKAMHFCISLFIILVILRWLFVFGVCVKNYVKLGRFHPNSKKAA